MKTRSSTPSHDLAADADATPTPQPRFTTPSLDSAAGRKQARPPPANPYRTPTRSTSENARPTSEKDRHTSPPQGDATSPTLLSEMGVDDDDHRPPPPPAPDERKATRRSTSYDGEDVEGVVYFTEKGVDGDGPRPTPPPAPDERTATRHSTWRTKHGLHCAMPTGTPRRITFGMDALPTPHHTDTLGTRTMLMRPISHPAIAAMDAGICVRIRTGTITGRLTTGRMMMTTRDTRRWGGRSNRPATWNAFGRHARGV